MLVHKDSPHTEHPLHECRQDWCGRYPPGHPRFVHGAGEEPTARTVDHPEYYGGGDNPYEAIKVIQAWELDFELGSALKYIARAGKKTPSATTDLEKAIRYLQFELEKLERSR